MDKSRERRRIRRIDAKRIPSVLRGCDLCLVDRGVDVDVTIEDVNSHGLGLQLGGELDEKHTPRKGDRVFIRGCIFDHLLGILSSEEATVAWCRLPSFGIVFDNPIGYDEEYLESVVDNHGR